MFRRTELKSMGVPEQLRSVAIHSFFWLAFHSV
jgi:hypothetical protein